MEINLIPWRDEIIAFNKKIFFRLMFAAIMLTAVLMVFVYHLFFSQLSNSESYTAALEQAKVSLVGNVTAYLDYKKIQKEIAARVVVLQKLEASRFETIRLFNEIAAITPKGVYLKKITRNDNEAEVWGVANSNLLVSQIIKAIDDSPEFDVISLQKVEKTEGQDLVVTQFDLKIVLTMSGAAPTAAVAPSQPATHNPITQLKNDAQESEKKLSNVGKN